MIFLDIISSLCDVPVLSDGFGVQSKQEQKGEEQKEKVEQGMKVFPLTVCFKPVSDMLFVKLFSPFQKPPARL